jgi:hypothetical protein
VNHVEVQAMGRQGHEPTTADARDPRRAGTTAPIGASRAMLCRQGHRESAVIGTDSSPEDTGAPNGFHLRHHRSAGMKIR